MALYTSGECLHAYCKPYKGKCVIFDRWRFLISTTLLIVYFNHCFYFRSHQGATCNAIRWFYLLFVSNATWLCCFIHFVTWSPACQGARGSESINIKSEKTKRGTEIWSWHFGGAASIVAIIAHWGRIAVGYKDVKAFKRC